MNGGVPRLKLTCIDVLLPGHIDALPASVSHASGCAATCKVEISANSISALFLFFPPKIL